MVFLGKHLKKIAELGEVPFGEFLLASPCTAQHDLLVSSLTQIGSPVNHAKREKSAGSAQMALHPRPYLIHIYLFIYLI